MDKDEILYITPDYGVSTGNKEEEPVDNSIESVDNLDIPVDKSKGEQYNKERLNNGRE